MINSKYIWNFDRDHLLNKLREFTEKIGNRRDPKDFESDGSFERIVLEVYPDINAYIRDYEELLKYKRTPNQEVIRTVLDRLRKLSERFDALDKGNILDIAYAIDTGYFYDGTKFVHSSLDVDGKAYDMVEFYKRLPDLSALYLLPYNAPTFFREAVDKVIRFISTQNIQPLKIYDSKKVQNLRGRTDLSVNVSKENSGFSYCSEPVTNEEINMILDYMEQTGLPLSHQIFERLRDRYIVLKISCKNNSDIDFIRKILFGKQQCYAQKLANFISLDISLSFSEKTDILKKIILMGQSLTDDTFSKMAEDVVASKFSSFVDGLRDKVERQVEYTNDSFKEVYGAKIRLKNFVAKIEKLRSIFKFMLAGDKNSLEMLYEASVRYGSRKAFDEELKWILNPECFRKDYNLAGYDIIIGIVRCWIERLDSMANDVGLKKYFAVRAREERLKQSREKYLKKPAYKTFEKYIAAYEKLNGEFDDREFLRREGITITEFTKMVGEVYKGCSSVDCEYPQSLYKKYQEIVDVIYGRRFVQVKNRLSVICDALRARVSATNSFDVDASIDDANILALTSSNVLALMPFKEPYYVDEFNSYSRFGGKDIKFSPPYIRNRVDIDKMYIHINYPRGGVAGHFPDTQQGRVLAFAQSYLSKDEYEVLKKFFDSTEIIVCDEEQNGIEMRQRLYRKYCGGGTVVYGNLSEKNVFGINYPCCPASISESDFNVIMTWMECLRLPCTEDVFRLMLHEYKIGSDKSKMYDIDGLYRLVRMRPQ